MPPTSKYLFLSILFFCSALTGFAQSGSLTDIRPKDSLGRGEFIINEIFISGNHKTKAFTIERELSFKKGDTIYLSTLVQQFQRSKELLFNTRLFNNVIVSVKNFYGYKIDVQIDVTERWYLFPVPYFKPVDRNLSAWAEKNYSFSRVNYGLKLLYNNFTGRNDRLRLWLITGYTRQIQLNYDQPYADKSMKHGYAFGLFYSALKEINISTENNRQIFFNTDSLKNGDKYLVKQAGFSLGYFYRPALTTRHSARFSMNYIETDSAVGLANAKYLNNGINKLWYPEFSYSIEYQKADYIAYVLRGFVGDINLTHRGINSNMNLTQLTGRFTNGWPLGHSFYYGLQGYGAVKLPFEQPYYNQRLFGYGDTYLRGLEKYVVDGVAGFMVRNTIRKKLLGFNLSGGRIPSLQIIPFSIYIKAYGDMGYAYNKTFPQNSLVNKMLYTTGLGLDVVTTYDFVFRCEYSINQLGEKGFFFHVRNDF